MSDNNSSTNEVAQKLFAGLQNFAPGAIEAINKTVGGTTQAQLGAEAGVSKGYNDLYNQNQLAAAQTEANVVNGPGQELVGAADRYQRELDPEFYKQRGMMSDALTRYLSSYDPNSLSPTELAQISRGINATTGPVTPSAMNTIKNAQIFGDAGTKRWQNFGDAITKAAQAIPALKSGLTGFNIATTRGQDSGARSAVNNSLGANFGFSTSALGNIAGVQNQARSQQISDWQKGLMASQMLGNVVGAAGSAAKIGA